ncbi:hypothetical protein AVEN_80559-1 [Araneus ventricosus]|uniref:Uncharacterized protein n=1 Tax=Araneus ventricosus TaxID=182803 RepID=A0A4Y2CRQ6_ARAVE|nr:hypothetical protein AVEN_80559-1 [Araneus ventricosus]
MSPTFWPVPVSLQDADDESEIGDLEVLQGRGRKQLSNEIAAEFALSVVGRADGSQYSSTSAPVVSRDLSLPWLTLRKILRSIVNWYLYKIYVAQALNPADWDKRTQFPRNALARISVDNSWRTLLMALKCVPLKLAVTETFFSSRAHFADDRAISRSFPTAWPSRSRDLNPCDFWLWGFPKYRVFGGSIWTRPEFQTSIARHIVATVQETLEATVEYTTTRFEHVLDAN